ncbi:hypothetical protein R3P38DRAFT_3235630 [Favolaschia claudopus]|uniref:Uncharacterized protein n=1 Tax=Favolaschia claudopus TaxID=2862362 RepID=A0AAV9ZFD5_9AGAR
MPAPTFSLDESDPDSVRRYKKWCASRAYNKRNREARNAKKRERMAMLRAKQKHDPPLIRAARLVAKEDSARRYREKNRELLAIKAWAARAQARRDDEVKRKHNRLRAVHQDRRLQHALHGLE